MDIENHFQALARAIAIGDRVVSELELDATIRALALVGDIDDLDDLSEYVDRGRSEAQAHQRRKARGLAVIRGEGAAA